MQYLTDTDLAGERGAHISDCGAYRYRLWREWDRSKPTLAFLMLNPSTADHLSDGYCQVVERHALEHAVCKYA
ncbi:DUF1643 domain-containing protein [Paraburkholderia panacisoli]|uniref:DUF1643 domain-containing protein n=1 Tax=Paraburkholderia panacisoli TaxID=2603818 RepID=A0A5B0G335_9BURK|nr:DUF1643 domain-containing protein [Paraburkholderia panacisoli]KAA0997816.1 DUF1643 domain-containing protein [Paraburkholderia panacisoli]